MIAGQTGSQANCRCCRTAGKVHTTSRENSWEKRRRVTEHCHVSRELGVPPGTIAPRSYGEDEFLFLKSFFSLFTRGGSIFWGDFWTK